MHTPRHGSSKLARLRRALAENDLARIPVLIDQIEVITPRLPELPQALHVTAFMCNAAAELGEGDLDGQAHAGALRAIDRLEVIIALGEIGEDEWAAA